MNHDSSNGEIRWYNVPLQLRELAERIEKGEQSARVVVCCVEPWEGMMPVVYGWGPAAGDGEHNIDVLNRAIAIIEMSYVVLGPGDEEVD